MIKSLSADKSVKINPMNENTYEYSLAVLKVWMTEGMKTLMKLTQTFAEDWYKIFCLSIIYVDNSNKKWVR